jgi:hypothetical protein
MKRLSFICFVAAALFLAGCGASTEESVSTSPAPAPGADAGTGVVDESLPEGTKDYKNKDGKLECPIMKKVIESPDKAAGFVVHDGVRYYLCCPDCAVKAAQDPASLAKAAQS